MLKSFLTGLMLKFLLLACTHSGSDRSSDQFCSVCFSMLFILAQTCLRRKQNLLESCAVHDACEPKHL